MQLDLSTRAKIKDIKKQFALDFPFLKLEFFRHRHKAGESSALVQKHADHLHLSEVSATVKEAVFSFMPSTTVAEFEQRLQAEHGLPVQVFRKAGNLWLETVQTDNLSLEKQNAMGEESATPARFNLYTLFL